MNTITLGLLGPAGAGKTTAARYLAEKYGARRYSCADPLKEIAMRTLGFTHAQCYGTQAEKEAVDPRYGFSPRWFLQKLGTDGCRSALGEDVWIDALVKRIAHDAPAFAVVEDLRFCNEASAIIASGGMVWRLEVEGATYADGHRSEREWLEAPHDRRIVAPVTTGSLALLREVDAAWAPHAHRVGWVVGQVNA